MSRTRHHLPPFPPVPSLPAALTCLLASFLLGGCFVNNTAPKTNAALGAPGETGNLVEEKPAEPALKVRFTPKQLIFSWGETAGASYYRLHENDGTGSGYRSVGGEIESTSYRLDIRFRPQGWAKTSYLLEACNSLGCSSSKELSAAEVIQPVIGHLESPSPDLSDYFATAVASSADGSTLAVGAPEEDGGDGDTKDNSLTGAGAVYLFGYDFDQGGWRFQDYLKADPPVESGRFGTALAISPDGTVLAVGAPFEPGGGAVYLFSRGEGKESRWSLQTTLKVIPSDVDRRFGASLALDGDGNTLVVGAPAEQSMTTANETELLGAGAVYLYSRNGEGWRLHSRLEPDSPAAGAGFGRAVAIDRAGTLVAIGADGWGTSAQQEGAGAVFLFSFDTTSSGWSQRVLVQPSTLSPGSRFGASVILDGDGTTLAVGAPRESGGKEIPHAGGVYLFQGKGNEWQQRHRIQAHNRGAHDEFGTALAFNQDASLLAVGAPFEDSSTTGVNEIQRDETGSNSGAIYLYSLTAEKWRQLAYIKPTAKVTERSYGEFGTSICLSNDSTLLAVGAPHLASRLLLNGEIIDTLNAPLGTGLLYLYSPPAIAK